MVRSIPEGAHNVVPHLIVGGAGRAIDFYKLAFGAWEVARHPMPDGSDRVMHAEIRIGDSRIYLADEVREMGNLSPKSLKGSPVQIHLWTDHADSLFTQAVAAGATVVMPLMDQFWGDRYGVVLDPFGHTWSIATHTADLTPEEMMRGAQEAFAKMPPPPAAARPKKARAKAAKKAAPRPKAKAKKAAARPKAKKATKRHK